ncbi:MAG: DUF5674 family protein [Patescibacteria group bacterium]
MEIQIVTDKLPKEQVLALAQDTFGDMVKVVVDIDKKILAIGGELHADAEAVLLDSGSKQKNVWGANIFPGRPQGEQVEFTSLINIRPKQGNTQTLIQNPAIQQQVAAVITERLAL